MIAFKLLFFASVCVAFCSAHWNIFSIFSGAHRFPQRYDPFFNRCPLCDSSVYSYCGEKLFHDACCCTDPLIHPLPYECRLADCGFLHAKSCAEHLEITNCCCSNGYNN